MRLLASDLVTLYRPRKRELRLYLQTKGERRANRANLIEFQASLPRANFNLQGDNLFIRSATVGGPRVEARQLRLAAKKGRLSVVLFKAECSLDLRLGVPV
jgi:hypothetical protein